MHDSLPVNDELLIRELQNQVRVYHDQAAYKALFLHLMPSIQNFAFSIVKSRQWAEEIACDMLMEVWIRRDRLHEISNLRLYLLTGAKNAAIRKLRTENKMARFSIEELEVEFISDYCSPSDQLESTELATAIWDAIQQLPPRCKMIYKLAKEDKLPYADISQLLDISVKTIDNQLSIALSKIAEAIRRVVDQPLRK